MTILTTETVNNLGDLRRFLAAAGPLPNETPVVLKVFGMTDATCGDVFSGICKKARVLTSPAEGGHRIILAAEDAL